MASPKRPTRAQMEKMLEKMQADMEVFKRKSEVLDTMVRPVLYLMRSGQDAATYVVGNAKSLKTMPAALVGADGEGDAEGLYYKMLEVGAKGASLAAELERCLSQFKASGGAGTGESYAVSFEEGKMWLDFVVGRAMLEGMTDSERRQEYLRRIVKILASADSGTEALAEETEEEKVGGAGGSGEAITPSGTVKKTKNAKVAEEREKIARFVAQRVVLDEDAPLIKKHDVLCMYRICEKGTTFYSSSVLVDYLADELNVKTDHIGPTKDGIIAFKGIALKKDDWKYDVAGDEPVKLFMREACNFSPTAKAFSRTIQDAYVKWREEKGLVALSQTDLRREVREQLKACPIVFGASLAIGDDSGAGWYGVALHGAEEEEASAKTPSPTRTPALKVAKVVERRMPGEGGKVLESWPSLAQAAKSLGMPAYKVQTLMRKAQPDADGAIIAFAQTAAGTSGGSSEKGDE